MRLNTQSQAHSGHICLSESASRYRVGDRSTWSTKNDVRKLGRYDEFPDGIVEDTEDDALSLPGVLI